MIINLKNEKVKSFRMQEEFGPKKELNLDEQVCGSQQQIVSKGHKKVFPW